jgi:hypothetical protein
LIGNLSPIAGIWGALFLAVGELELELSCISLSVRHAHASTEFSTAVMETGVESE